ncbi:udp-galactose transporter [Klebsormidium nitens]|uniref:Udp-galactose transporter n=1 Tax=Klebsormidium nitens TaxID=105231 RepID=A0A1Y1HWU4_KLENI|nr:udp-galactose transporter [Klebsormidium nitens]|eukprot:GAQ80976.1 udp-galactose transporter [Klebsormidium nitens]
MESGLTKAAPAYASPSTRQMRLFRFLLVFLDCIFIGMQPILVYMCKDADGTFPFNPVSVNFLTEVTKTTFAVGMLLTQARRQTRGERSLLSKQVVVQAARANYLLAVPAGLFAVNNYLKFVMQLYFKPATVKMLGNLKILVIALLLKLVMRRRFSTLQWEALCLLLIGISVNQIPTQSNSDGPVQALPLAGYLCTLLTLTIPSTASVYNEYTLKKNFETSVHLQNLFLYSYGLAFNLLGLVAFVLAKPRDGRSVFAGHSAMTMLLVANNAMQGILGSFFFKYADTILKKYSSTIATIVTGLASAALFGHTLTINFVLGISIVFISMHQFFSTIPPSKAKVAPEPHAADGLRFSSVAMNGSADKDVALMNMSAGAEEQVPLIHRKDSASMLLPR